MFIALRNRLNDDEDGFTLIELLVVVIIIGILAAIAVPTFLSQREKAGRSAAKSDIRNAAIAQESYYTESSPASYAATEAALTELRVSGGVDLKSFGSTTGFCISATHTNMTETGKTHYKLVSTAASSEPVFATGHCTAATG